MARGRNVEAEQWGAVVRHDEAERRQEIQRALYRAALRGEAIVAEATPVDRGHARNAWYVQPMPDGSVILANDWPYIGILERGSRPHYPPLMPILRWLVRKEGLDLAGGRRSFETFDEVPYTTYLAAKAVQEKIGQEGTKPHRMVADNLDQLTTIAGQEIDHALRFGGGGSDNVPF